MINIEEMIGKTYYRPVPKIDHKNDTKEFVPEEVMLTKKRNIFYWGNEQCHPSWLIEKTLVFFETKEKCENKCNQLNYEKGYVKVDENNIHLYYEFMSDEDLNTIDYDFIQNLDLAYRQHKVLGKIFETENSFKIMDLQHKFASYRLLSFKPKELLVSRTQIGIDYKIFGVKDTLKPIDEYIAAIKDSEQYKIFTSECRCNNCMTYFESDDDLIDGEDEDGEFKGCPKCNTDKYLMNLADLK